MFGEDGIGGNCSLEGDIDHLFESLISRNPSKRPVKGGVSPASRIGITEPVSLKQALRGLCITQASVMAATKRFSKTGSNLASSDAVTIRRLYRAAVIKADGDGLPPVVEISLVSEGISSDATEEEHKTRKLSRVRSLRNEPFLDRSVEVASPKEIVRDPSSCDLVTPIDVRMGKPHASSTLSSFPTVKGSNRTVFNPSYFLGPMRGKIFVKKRLKQGFAASNCSCPCSENLEHPALPSSIIDQTIVVHANGDNVASGKHCSASARSVRTKFLVRKAEEKSGFGEKGEFSQSSKSSLGDFFSCSASSSETSNLSRSTKKPHTSKDWRWEAIRSVQTPNGDVNLRHLQLLKRLGSGDIGTVYLAELTGTDCLFTLKVMDLEFLGVMKKLTRAQREKDIMQMLDHPFLPTLYAYISTEKLSCLVMEYCPGGDLHVLRQKQPTRTFSAQAARFYVAEVLLALEYLHMLGVVYRHLKPENVLIREDGHIMLSDFDLSLRCSANLTVVPSSPESEPTKKMSTPCTDSGCVEPFCLNPSFQVPCFAPSLSSVPSKSRKPKPDLASQISPPLPQLVVEPISVRSNSFVGTHEYLAPEIIKGEGHGSTVDWWLFGIFLYELLFGKTPFKGLSNDETLANVVARRLKFPDSPAVSYHTRDLIRGLLIKNPENRLGSRKGAAEIKQHQFFKGLNWALIRCAVPPEIPSPFDGSVSCESSQKDTSKEILKAEMQMGFEVF